MCKCGCKGWCSIWAVLNVWRWDLTQCSLGVRAGGRHDGRPFDEQNRVETAGAALPFVAAVVEIRSDWPAFCEVSGFRTWAHSQHPCCFCTVDHEHLLHFNNVSLVNGPWDAWRHEENERELATCIKVLTHVNCLWF